jgi:site-specific recombinase XerD
MSTMNKRFSLFFYLKKQKNKKENYTVYLRLIIDGRRTEICTKRTWESSRWHSAAGRAKGTKEDTRILNAFLDLLQAKVYEAHHAIISSGKTVSAELIKNMLSGFGEKAHTLIEVIKAHNHEIFQLIGKGYCKATWTKYNTTLTHVQHFLSWKYKVSDIHLKDIRYSFVTDFEFYLKAEKNVDTNTNGKYIKNLKKIIHECQAKGWLDKDPFLGFKVKHKDADIPHLSAAELKIMEDKIFTIDRLAQVKDIFLFSCYTGLAYADSARLTQANIEIGMDGKKWLSKNRQKTDVPSRLPLLSQALAILDKYKDHPKVCNSGKLLPFLSNQKANAYLKEIADACGIRKNITFHVARHTFATTVTLSNGVPIETVSKMLGHRKISTTQVYAKILDNKVSADMDLLQSKLLAAASGKEIEKTDKPGRANLTAV